MTAPDHRPYLLATELPLPRPRLPRRREAAVMQLALDMLPPGVRWRRTGARGPACLPLPGAVPSLCTEWRSALGGRVWLPCDPRPGCEGCASLAEHRCEP